MIVSMTGYGRASRKYKAITFSAELRSINSKYLEISSKLPLVLSDKESDIKELISRYITRGKVTLTLTIERNSKSNINLKIQKDTIRDYYTLLSQIKSEINSDEEIKIEHLLNFSEIFKVDENGEINEHWVDIKKTLSAAVTDLIRMKKSEGRVLEKDISKRLANIGTKLNNIKIVSAYNLKNVKDNLEAKVKRIVNGKFEIDKNRLEYELVLLSDKMDITEEIVRARSHIDYFRKNVRDKKELSGRRLNFLVQEINREINTISSKANSSEISQNVVEMKEELEKIKEQLQNVE